MNVEIFTLFPEMFSPLEASIIGRGRKKGAINVGVTDIRSYADDPHFADDGVYGGGAGMVLKAEPVLNALRAKGWQKGKKVIVTTPAGKPFTQREAMRLAKEAELFIVAGHYEGIDQRVVDITDAEELSIGDFVLTGGELPAMVMADAILRLVPGVVGDSASLEQESFSFGLLEHPQYTRPRVVEGHTVPDVLFCGDHKVIDAWRRQESLRRTAVNRPDLLAHVPLSDEDAAIVAAEKKRRTAAVDIYVALVHHPVLDPKGHTITTSVTNLDIHDIARLCRTYDVKGYFLIQPGEEQQELTARLLDYWRQGHGGKVNPDRKEALSLVSVVDSLEDAVGAVTKTAGARPLTVGTSAKVRENIVAYAELKRRMWEEDRAFLLVFGTGYGLTDDTLAAMDYVVKPIDGRGDYNHLSVRSAASIILDRLLGD